MPSVSYIIKVTHVLVVVRHTITYMYTDMRYFVTILAVQHV